MAVYEKALNARLGLAPSTGSWLSRWESRRAAYPGASGPTHVGTVAAPKARMRMQRWGVAGEVRLVPYAFAKSFPSERPEAKPGIRSGVKNETKIGLRF